MIKVLLLATDRIKLQSRSMKGIEPEEMLPYVWCAKAVRA
jgi:hypothetical protein